MTFPSLYPRPGARFLMLSLTVFQSLALSTRCWGSWRWPQLERVGAFWCLNSEGVRAVSGTECQEWKGAKRTCSWKCWQSPAFIFVWGFKLDKKLFWRIYFLSFLLKFIAGLLPSSFLVLTHFLTLIKTSCPKEARSDLEAMEGRELDAGPCPLLSCLQLTRMQTDKSCWRRGLCSHEGPPCGTGFGVLLPSGSWLLQLWRAKPALTSCHQH